MKRLYVLSGLLMISSLLVPMQARSITTALEKTKLTHSQTTALLQLIIHERVIKKLLSENKLQTGDVQQIMSTFPRSQTLGFLLHFAQMTAKLDRAYSHTKTRSLVSLARRRSRELDGTFTIQNSI
jgi:ribosomal 50S subunit-associated protein YjgA (DUF615 family)